MLRGSLGQAYRRVLWANTVSSVGAGVYVAALPLLAYTVTRDPRLIAFVSAAEFLPWLVWSLPAGVIVDRYDRAVLMWRSQVVQGVIIAMIAVLLLVHQVDIALLILAGFLLGSAAASGRISRSSCCRSTSRSSTPPTCCPRTPAASATC
jgi:MFS family permease